jgi:hypothetical protein
MGTVASSSRIRHSYSLCNLVTYVEGPCRNVYGLEAIIQYSQNNVNSIEPPGKLTYPSGNGVVGW